MQQTIQFSVEISFRLPSFIFICVLFFFILSFSFCIPTTTKSATKFDLYSSKTLDRRASSSGITDTPSGSSAFASKADSTEHLQRLRQKLHQLRSLPSTSCDFAEQSIAITVESPPPANTSSEPDLDQDELLDIIYERRSSASSAASKEKQTKPLELQFLGEPFRNAGIFICIFFFGYSENLWMLYVVYCILTMDQCLILTFLFFLTILLCFFCVCIN